MSLIRLDKYIAKQSILTRTDAKKVIADGRVSVNNEICKEFDKKIDTDTATVLIDGKQVEYEEYQYFLINKPAGVISASSDKSRETVVDLLGSRYKNIGLSPVGRLDKDTTGFLILTNDGEFLHKVINPKSDIKKRYLVSLDGELNESIRQKFKEGITLKDGTKCKSAELAILDKNTAEVTVTEGKYHEIKRMFGVVGLGVNKLHRQGIGGFELPYGLKSGEFIKLNRKEVEKVLE